MESSGNLYESDEFMALWQAVNRSYVPWEEFRRLPMPAGASPEDTWRAIALLRRGAGTVFEYPPWFPYRPDGSIWFSTPKDRSACA